MYEEGLSSKVILSLCKTLTKGVVFKKYLHGLNVGYHSGLILHGMHGLNEALGSTEVEMRAYSYIVYFECNTFMNVRLIVVIG